MSPISFWGKVFITAVVAAGGFWALGWDIDRTCQARFDAISTPLVRLPLGCRASFTSIEMCCAFLDGQGNRFSFCSY